MIHDVQLGGVGRVSVLFRSTFAKTMNVYLNLVREIERELEVSTDLAKLYALLVLTNVITDENVHEAWALWVCDTFPGHRSLIPYDQLPPDVQALDTPYTQKLREICIYFGGSGEGM